MDALNNGAHASTWGPYKTSAPNPVPALCCAYTTLSPLARPSVNPRARAATLLPSGLPRAQAAQEGGKLLRELEGVLMAQHNLETAVLLGACVTCD